MNWNKYLFKPDWQKSISFPFIWNGFHTVTVKVFYMALGYSLEACFCFAVGGIFYAGITIRSGSIIPAVIWHFILNDLMILSGIISYIG
ncbi:hypothetical protein [Bacillus sp. S/N-304-OC-R1]|uniref:hypothetical protein n=1 Tax=Bacillus sp. S/N-304-OC-R1 TaxID=2758034 RepID=UPI001C8EFA8D|nr:hypothetical protein [Bacillus sp. S/N-304-OC-R1]MBY0120516.1 hypothetical protein [Bacillus sp. S/N-304-OC-R1]